MVRETGREKSFPQERGGGLRCRRVFRAEQELGLPECRGGERER